MQQLGLGGGCHWCTEGIFSSVLGVQSVDQGWIASTAPNDALSEAILLKFDPNRIDLNTLIAMHLHSHSATSTHSMRGKYRSAVYVFDPAQAAAAQRAIAALQTDFEQAIITEVLPFASFKRNTEEFLNYYHSNPDKPFCNTYIAPKLRALMKQFCGRMDASKVAHLSS